MITRAKEAKGTKDANLTEEEKIEKKQRELVPGGKLKWGRDGFWSSKAQIRASTPKNGDLNHRSSVAVEKINH